jgi:hypothetical protein
VIRNRFYDLAALMATPFSTPLNCADMHGRRLKSLVNHKRLPVVHYFVPVSFCAVGTT